MPAHPETPDKARLTAKQKPVRGTAFADSRPSSFKSNCAPTISPSLSPSLSPAFKPTFKPTFKPYAPRFADTGLQCRSRSPRPNHKQSPKNAPPKTRVAFLSAQEEARLLEAWQKQGCRTALQRLVCAHMPLVVAEVRRLDCPPPHRRLNQQSYKPSYKRQSYRQSYRQDLLQEGALALIEAAQRFHPSHKARFATYARLWVAGRLCKQRQFANRPIPRVLSLSPSLYSMQYQHPEDWDAGQTYESCLGRLHRPALLRAVGRALETLPPRHAAIIRLRYLNPLHPHDPASLREVGAHLSLSSERVRQLEKEALALLTERLAPADARPR